jgi:hypothetical protein
MKYQRYFRFHIFWILWTVKWSTDFRAARAFLLLSASYCSYKSVYSQFTSFYVFYPALQKKKFSQIELVCNILHIFKSWFVCCISNISRLRDLCKTHIDKKYQKEKHDLCLLLSRGEAFFQSSLRLLIFILKIDWSVTRHKSWSWSFFLSFHRY